MASLSACSPAEPDAIQFPPVAHAQPTPHAPIEVLLTGHDFRWESRYAGADGVLGSEDDIILDDALHLPAHADVRLHLTSRDYIYFLSVPFAQQKEMAVPDLLHSMRFDSGASAQHRLPGDQMCGYAHDSLFIDLVVESGENFERWLGRHDS